MRDDVKGDDRDGLTTNNIAADEDEDRMKIMRENVREIEGLSSPRDCPLSTVLYAYAYFCPISLYSVKVLVYSLLCPFSDAIKSNYFFFILSAPIEILN